MRTGEAVVEGQPTKDSPKVPSEVESELSSSRTKRITARSKVCFGILGVLLLSATIVAAFLAWNDLHEPELHHDVPRSVVNFTFFDVDNNSTEANVAVNREEFENAVKQANESMINFTFVDHQLNFSIDIVATPQNTSFLGCNAKEKCDYGLLLDPPVSFTVGGMQKEISRLHCHDNTCSTASHSRRAAAMLVAEGVFFVLQVAWWAVTEPGGGCFPSGAKVVTPAGPKTMAEVRIGDMLLDSDGSFSPVYLFGHSDPAALTTFVSITTDSGHNLRLSPLHYIEADGSYMHAKDVLPGMSVAVHEERTTGFKKFTAAVKSTGQELLPGLYNPYTTSGTVVVDGVVASAHSEWFLEGLVPPRFAPRLYQVLLAPVRAIFHLHPQWVVRFTEHFDKSPLPLDQHG
eukprot:3938114-Rhodomonas_salina.1